MDYRNFQKILIEKALAAGFSDCEVYYKGSKHFEVMIMEGEVSDYENSALQGISFRGTWQGRKMCIRDRAMAAVAGMPPKKGSRILPTPWAISS